MGDLETLRAKAGGARTTQVFEILRAVGELPDRTSPENWPEGMLVTGAELELIVAQSQDAYGEAMRALGRAEGDKRSPRLRDSVAKGKRGITGTVPVLHASTGADTMTTDRRPQYAIVGGRAYKVRWLDETTCEIRNGKRAGERFRLTAQGFIADPLDIALAKYDALDPL